MLSELYLCTEKNKTVIKILKQFVRELYQRITALLHVITCSRILTDELANPKSVTQLRKTTDENYDELFENKDKVSTCRVFYK